MRAPRLGLFHKVFAPIAALVTATALALGILFFSTTRQVILDELVERGKLLASSLSKTCAKGAETDNLFHTLDPIVGSVAGQRDVVYIDVLDARGRVLASSRLPKRRRVEDERLDADRRSPEPRARQLSDGVLEIAQAIVSSPGDRLPRRDLDGSTSEEPGRVTGVLRVGMSLRGFEEGARRIGLLAVLVTGVLIACGTAVGLFLSRWIARRIRSVVAATQKVGGGDYAVRLEARAGDELGALAEGFNHMTERLAEARDELERRVAERTSELEAALDDLEHAQAQLVQQGKMAAVGQLAGGIAHEINNPLAVILGFAQGMERRLGPDDKLRLPVTSIVREALRSKALVSELLTFSRTAKRATEDVDVNRVVEASVLLLATRARTEGISVGAEPGEASVGELGAVWARANRTQLEQVLVNLGTNAMDAMERGGKLTYRTGREPDGRARIEVADTGTGIPEAIRSRIFEPFFTTKPVGKGTGLGLSLVYEIVQQHGGSIEVDSAIGRGTTIIVRLPAAGPGEKPKEAKEAMAA